MSLLPQNTNVTSFTESSANARTVTVGMSMPTRVSNVLNGQPVVRFDGVNDYMVVANSQLDVPYSIVVIAKGTVGGIFGGGNGNTWTPRFYGTNQYAIRTVGTEQTAVGPDHTTGFVMVRCLIGAGATCDLAVNETKIVSSADTGSTGFYIAASQMIIGAVQSSNPGSFFSGDIAYIGVFYGDVTQSALWSAFKTWVTNKYGITLA